MGVRGIKHLLQDVGWLDPTTAEAEDSNNDTPNGKNRRKQAQSSAPSTCDYTGKLWKEWNASDAFLGSPRNGPPLERIPPNAKFFIDGNGLAFHLHSIAYARHLQSIKVNNINARNNATLTTKEIMDDPKATTLALPCMLPLSTLRRVTKEFVAGLKKHLRHEPLRVCWDGPSRRFKADTERQRQMERDRQESYLELYCNHGTLVTATKKKPLEYVCQWREVFPFSGIFTTCVRHALLEEGGVENIECQEEADVVLAQLATGDMYSYVLGFDSDFFFYKDIQYIPLDQIAVSSSSSSGGLHAFVARREELAKKLGFGYHEDKLIDLALLMGNDYVDPFVCLDTPKDIDLCSIQSMVYYLQCHEDYKVAAKSDKVRAPVDFVRSLYNLHSLDSFPLGQSPSNTLPDDDEERTNGESRSSQGRLLSHESSVRDGILRYLRSILDRAGPDAKLALTEESIRALELSSSPELKQTLPDLNVRPTYREMKAAKFIERCISRFFRNSPDSLLIRATPPEFLMSRVHFHAALASCRHEAEVIQEAVPEAIPDPEPTPERISLPIDEHEEAILENIRNHRVTIIHGETGCGKSSRVPVMLLKSSPPDGSLRKVRFFISQPRRIAAKALVERVRSCEPELRDKFALRMGHGWREYESTETQVHFVTTGYLVRLLANHPERFNSCTHLVIDEVHERSVDTDILCLLCRRLLETNRRIRLVLMSATLATKMYREYFNVANEPIHVGVRRYPITEYFVEDLAHFGLPEQEAAAAVAIEKEVNKGGCIAPPNSTEMKKRFSLAARLATIVGQPGTSVLVFVPGMAEIIAISELIESYHRAGVRYTCFPIHGDIPFEEQMEAFNAPGIDEVKIIIATNAAESSVTLPNVDHVICLGLCRQIVYNQASHRQMLTPAWISRASATQRAGRTGRVRPGNVYHLYTRRAFEKYLDEFEPGEMLRIPLDSVILMLKQILHEEVRPVFMECLEPPALDTIDRSFESLYYWNFLTKASDQADITPLGSFVTALGIDLSLGSFVGLGIQFGVAAEAIEMAAMMSLSKTPFIMASPMWLTPGKFNKLASQTYASKCKFDAGLYSEPMGLMNALWDNECQQASRKYSWTTKNNLVMKRWQQVISSRNSLRKRVADFVGIHEERLRVQLPPRDMPHEKLVILRILKVWVFSNSIIECPPSKLKLSRDGSVALSVKGRSSVILEESHLDRILKPELHPFSIGEKNETRQAGVFEEEEEFLFSEFVDKFESRLLSYASEKNIGAALCHSDQDLCLYLEKTDAVREFVNSISSVCTFQNRFAYDVAHKTRRGIQERPSGLWTVLGEAVSDTLFVRKKEFLRIDVDQDIVEGDEFDRIRASTIEKLSGSDIKSKMIWHFFTQNRKKKQTKKTSVSQPFWVATLGECQKISGTDLEDLLGKKPQSLTTNTQKSVQSIVLRPPPNSKKQETSEFCEPLFVDVPEGARILAMLASSQRKGKRNVLKIPIDVHNMESEETYVFAFNEAEVDVSQRWKRLNTSNRVYVDDSVPATAIHTSSNLFAVAANGLEIRSGGLKVEGLTLLPPNPLFLVLSHLSFGIEINQPLLWATAHGEEYDRGKKKISKSYTWLKERAIRVSKKIDNMGDQIMFSQPPVTENSPSQPNFWYEEELKNRLEQASDFSDSCSSMEEKLVCFPEKIRELCELFDGVDGHALSPWESIDDESLTTENLKKWQWERKTSTSEEQQPHSLPSPSDANPQAAPSTASKSSGSSKNHGATARVVAGKKNEIRNFGPELIASSKKLFATTLSNGEDMPAFPSTNILALIFQQFEEIIRSEEKSFNENRNFKVALDASNWHITSHKGKGDDGFLYQARFLNDSIAKIPAFGRGKNKLPKWIKKDRFRPSTIVEAKQCVPPTVACPTVVESAGSGLRFESIEDALTMESAFWLNHQFCHAGKSGIRHWYAFSVEQMIELLRKHEKKNENEND